MARYEIWYADENGNKLELLDNITSFEYAIVDGDIGFISLTLPSDDSKFYMLDKRDRNIQIFRAARSQSLQLEVVGLARKWQRATDGNGLRNVNISAPDINELTARRIVAYQESRFQDGGAYSAPVGDIILQVARDNLTDATRNSADRDMTSAGLSVMENENIGPSTQIVLAWKEVRKALQDLQNTSRSLGNEVFWRIVPVGLTEPYSLFQLRVYTGQPGANRSASGYSPIIFSTHFGNLTDVQYADDYSQEANYIYAGGRNVGRSKLVGTASDSDAIEQTKWNRREVFINASGAQTTAEIEQVAGQALNSMRPKRLFSATILSTEATPYGGNGWKFGDRVTISDSGFQFDAIIRSVHVKVKDDGSEEISASVEGVS